MTITRGKIPGAVKVVVYGPEGIGKSTFASCFPEPVFIDTEGSTAHMDVARFDPPEKWQDILDTVDWCIAHPDHLQTLVIDTMDWAEKLAVRFVCQEELVNGKPRNWDNIESPGYGKGYVYLKNAVAGLMDRLQLLTVAGVNVVITAHAILKKFEQPDEMGAYDRWALKLQEKHVAPLVKEWADLVLFANYRTNVVRTQDGKMKGTGGQKRIMYTQHSACWDAKNRFGLADELPFEFDQIAGIFERTRDAAQVTPEPPAVDAKPAEDPKPAAKPAKKKAAKELEARPDYMSSDNPEKDKALAKLWELMQASGIPETVLRGVVAEKEYYDLAVPVNEYELDFINDVLIEAWEQVLKLCQTKIFDLPF